MKRLVTLATLLAVTTASQSVCAQGQIVSDPLRVWADACSYKYFQDASVSYIEIYCGIQRADFQFEDVGDGIYEAVLFLYAEAMTKEGAMVDSVSRMVAIYVPFLEDAYKEDVRVFEVVPMLLPPGDYQMRVTAVDGITKRSGFSTFDMRVKNFSGNDLQLSDLEFAYSITPIAQDTVFSPLVKGKKRIIPNPNKYYSNEDSLIYVYAELYNLSEESGRAEGFRVSAVLNDSYGWTVREYPHHTMKKPGTTAIITQAYPIFGVPGGMYELTMTVEDLATGRKANGSRKFMVIYSFDQLSPTMSSSTAFTEEDAALMDQVIRYITTKEEKETYRKLDLEGKKRFLAQFWERKNPNPGSPHNAFKNEIFRRYAYANQYYSTSHVERSDGWRTDRGRVYITYGNPDWIERFPSAMGSKPYEVWHYDRLPDQKGNDRCLFVDEDGYGNYRLVHSTLRGEVSNPDWEARLTEDRLLNR